MISGGFNSAYQQILPGFEAKSGERVVTVYGPSMGTTVNAIPVRLARGEKADVLIMVRSALDALEKDGQVMQGSEVDLGRSPIAMAVKAGSPLPDISTVQAFRQTLLRARSVAYSDSASGVYVANRLFRRLGIAKQMAGKSHQIPAVPVGLIVARGDAEIGFQQLSELLPIPGIKIVGLIPAPLQRITVFSAGVAASSADPAEARELIDFLASGEAAAAIQKSGMTPVAAAR